MKASLALLAGLLVCAVQGCGRTESPAGVAGRAVGNCLANPALCSDGICISEAGGFRCACEGTRTSETCRPCAEGYRYHGKSFACVPTCAVVAPTCEAPKVCVERFGTVACACPDGTDGPDCTPQQPAMDAAPPATCRATCGSVENPVGTAPFVTKFRFRNGSAAPLFLRAGCLLEYRITSCERCHADDLGPAFTCGVCRCDDATCRPGGVACGACQEDRGERIEPGGVLETSWSGTALRTGDTAGCHAPLPAAHYGLELFVYDSAADAVARRGGRTVKFSFPLGAAETFDFDVGAPSP